MTNLHRMVEFVRAVLTDHSYFSVFITLVLVAEAILNFVIIQKVPYTEIDWIAYMEEVGEPDGFLAGQRDYSLMRGQTGPLVYPAGFVYIYSALYYITGKGADIRLCQYLFLALYLLFIFVVMKVYNMTKAVPPYVMLLLCASRRIHSIFVLRLFNDCFCMLFLYGAVYLVMKNRWSLGCALFSLSVSIKMNCLLFAPPLGLLLWKRFGFVQTLPKLAICAAVQIVLALPFLVSFPLEYFHGAFDFSRQFKYVWTVNLKFLPEDVFLDKRVGLALLAAHVVVLLLFLNKMDKGGIWKVFTQSFSKEASAHTENPFTAERVVTGMFVGNFVGIVFARSLHYQFYVWYYHTLPYLLWITPLPAVVKLFVLVVIEVCWNVFPATAQSSGALAACHALIMAGLWVSKRVSHHSEFDVTGAKAKSKKVE